MANRVKRGWSWGRVVRTRTVVRARTAWVGHRSAVGRDLGRAAGCRRQVAESHRLLGGRAVRFRVGVGGAEPKGRWTAGVGADGARAGRGGLRGTRVVAGLR